MGSYRVHDIRALHGPLLHQWSWGYITVQGMGSWSVSVVQVMNCIHGPWSWSSMCIIGQWISKCFHGFRVSWSGCPRHPGRHVLHRGRELQITFRWSMIVASSVTASSSVHDSLVLIVLHDRPPFWVAASSGPIGHSIIVVGMISWLCAWGASQYTISCQLACQTASFKKPILVIYGSISLLFQRIPPLQITKYWSMLHVMICSENLRWIVLKALSRVLISG